MKGKQENENDNKIGIGIGILAILSPIGLLLPDMFNSGAAWGEWGTDEIKKMTGYIPLGMEKLSSLWTAIFPDYSFSGQENQGLADKGFAYIVSAFAGIALCVGLGCFSEKFFQVKNIPENNQPEINQTVRMTISKKTSGACSNERSRISSPCSKNRFPTKRFARGKGFLQSCDPRFKIVASPRFWLRHWQPETLKNSGLSISSSSHCPSYPRFIFHFS